MEKRTNIEHLENQHSALKLFRFFVICLLVGRSYQAFFFDLPLRTFFWDEYLLKDFVEYISNDTWQAYVTNKSFPTDWFISILHYFFGGIWLITAIIVIGNWMHTRLASVLVWSSSGLLLMIAVLYSKERFWQFAQFFEYATQVLSPIIYLKVFRSQKLDHTILLMANIAIAITFVSHGLYALGYYQQPDYWLQWCKATFYFTSDNSASTFLYVMGVLDVIAAVGIFIKGIRKWALLYCVIWGLMTALARIYCNFYIDIPMFSIANWIHETTFRLIHGGLPLFMYLCIYKK